MKLGMLFTMPNKSQLASVSILLILAVTFWHSADSTCINANLYAFINIYRLCETGLICLRKLSDSL